LWAFRFRIEGGMGKNPAFQFYPADWISDSQLQMASTTSKGVWIQLLCYMWWSPSRGQVTGTRDDLCMLVRCRPEDLQGFIDDNIRYHFADVTECNNAVTIINRRMMREEKARESTRYRVQRFRNKIGNASVTVHSSSSSSSSSSKHKILLANPDGFAAFWAAYPRKVGRQAAMQAWAKIQPQNGLVETILSALTTQAKTWTEVQFIPHPATWLNGRRWEDVLIQSVPAPIVADPKTVWKTPENYRAARTQGRVPPTQRVAEWER
jgi:hypothetical protein